MRSYETVFFWEGVGQDNLSAPWVWLFGPECGHSILERDGKQEGKGGKGYIERWCLNGKDKYETDGHQMGISWCRGLV